MPLAIQGIDEAVLLWIQEAVRQAWLDPVVKAFTTLGNEMCIRDRHSPWSLHFRQLCRLITL